MRGNKRTFPNFHICFLIFVNSNSFQIQNPREKMTWLLPFKMKRVFEKYLNSIGKYFPIQKLYATQWFSREKIKWLLQIMKYELGVSKDQFQVLLELIFNLDLFEFYSNYFSPKIKYMEIRVTWFPTVENWREINLNLFWYF